MHAAHCGGPPGDCGESPPCRHTAEGGMRLGRVCGPALQELENFDKALCGLGSSAESPWLSREELDSAPKPGDQNAKTLMARCLHAAQRRFRGSPSLSPTGQESPPRSVAEPPNNLAALSCAEASPVAGSPQGPAGDATSERERLAR